MELVLVALVVVLGALLVREHLAGRAVARRSDAVVASLRSELGHAEDQVEAAHDARRSAEERADQAHARLVEIEEENDRLRAAADAYVVASALWSAELVRGERAWRESLAPIGEVGPPEGARGALLATALGWDLERLREEAGVGVTLDGTIGVDLSPLGALALLRAAQEVVAGAVRGSDALSVTLSDVDDAAGASVVIDGEGGAPVGPEAGVVEDLLTAVGGSLHVASGRPGRWSMALQVPSGVALRGEGDAHRRSEA